jgi:hypothetical protein
MRWRRLDLPGHDEARLRNELGSWLLEGHAEFIDGTNPWELGYTVSCTPDWTTTRAIVKGHSDRGAIEAKVVRSAVGGWTLNGAPVPAVAGCTSEAAYDYSAPDLPFAGILTVDPEGFVRDYAGLWRADPPSTTQSWDSGPSRQVSLGVTSSAPSRHDTARGPGPDPRRNPPAFRAGGSRACGQVWPGQVAGPHHLGQIRAALAQLTPG